MKCLLIHDWGEWENVPGQCLQERKCKKCPKRQTEALPHDFDKWTYVQDNCCKQSRICKVCGFKEEREEHTYGEWHYYEEECCTMKKVCTRCGDTIFQQQCPEPMIEVDKSQCLQKTICPRCKNTKVKSVEHIWEKSITSYRACLTYVIEVNTLEVKKIQNEMDWILQNTKGDSTDLRYQDLAGKMEVLQHDIVLSNVKLDIASEYTRGRVCKNCHYIEKLGRTEHFNE